jgi:hypothetical protein
VDPDERVAYRSQHGFGALLVAECHTGRGGAPGSTPAIEEDGSGN